MPGKIVPMGRCPMCGNTLIMVIGVGRAAGAALDAVMCLHCLFADREISSFEHDMRNYLYKDLEV
jgi:hypothetical protein